MVADKQVGYQQQVALFVVVDQIDQVAELVDYVAPLAVVDQIDQVAELVAPLVVVADLQLQAANVSVLPDFELHLQHNVRG